MGRLRTFIGFMFAALLPWNHGQNQEATNRPPVLTASRKVRSLSPISHQRRSSIMSTITVIDYVLGRLHDIGVTDIFGVPGDFAFGVQDAIVARPDINW